MFVIHSPAYHIDIGLHVFPTAKYQKVLVAALDAGLVRPDDVIAPQLASWEELALVHTAEYLARMREGALTGEELAQIELPWSPSMVDGFRLMTGGTILAARLACGIERAHPRAPTRRFTVVCHIGGGLHHAFPNHGEGFCPFNDIAVAVRTLQCAGIARTAIVDLDVHHGNGTAFIFNPRGAAPPRDEDRLLERTLSSPHEDPSVFTFSMHQQHNYPVWKPRGSLDIGLPDGTHDEAYLAALERALPTVMARAPDCVFYLAGADPFEDDQLGGLRLTKAGLRARDRMVVDAAKSAGIPLIVTLAGGYARNVDDTVAIHTATIDEAAAAMRDSGG